MKNYLCHTLLLAATVTSSAWAAQTPNVSPKNASKHELPSLIMLDKNHDGLVSRDEGFSDEDVSKYWDKLDVNLDGSLDSVEFAKLNSEVNREEALKTDHPEVVQQYEKGKYISPKEQIERNKRESKE